MAVGNASEGIASVLSPWSIWALKTVLMGTNTPHTCIPGLVWQKQARRFSQFELKVGELGFPIHFVCVSAALYNRGHAAAIFSPEVNTVHFADQTVILFGYSNLVSRVLYPNKIPRVLYPNKIPRASYPNERLRISKSSILKNKRKWRTKTLDQSELEPETPGSRNFGLLIWAIYNSTTRSGKRVLK